MEVHLGLLNSIPGKCNAFGKLTAGVRIIELLVDLE